MSGWTAGVFHLWVRGEMSKCRSPVRCEEFCLRFISTLPPSPPPPDTHPPQRLLLVYFLAILRPPLLTAHWHAQLGSLLSSGRSPPPPPSLPIKRAEHKSDLAETPPEAHRFIGSLSGGGGERRGIVGGGPGEQRTWGGGGVSGGMGATWGGGGEQVLRPRQVGGRAIKAAAVIKVGVYNVGARKRDGVRTAKSFLPRPTWIFLHAGWRTLNHPLAPRCQNSVFIARMKFIPELGTWAVFLNFSLMKSDIFCIFYQVNFTGGKFLALFIKKKHRTGAEKCYSELVLRNRYFL